MAARVGVGSFSVSSDRLEVGSRLLALAGVAVFVYGFAFLVINFTNYTELGLSAQQAGGAPAQIHGFSPALYNYISHLQVAISGFMVAFSVQLIGLAWFGVRRGERWALWTVAAASALAYVIGIPLHFVYGLATVVHLGPFGLVAVVLIAGLWLAGSGMKGKRASR